MISAVSLLLLGATTATVNASIVYAGSGYPTLSHTDGHPEMGAVNLPTASAYFLAGQRVTLPSDILVTDIAGVASSTTDNWGLFSPVLDVYKASGSLTREEVFASSLQNGNAFHSPIAFSGTPVPFGTGFSGFPNYYAEFQFAPFFLPAGDYIFSLSMTTVGQSWAWLETDFDLDGAIYTEDTHPGQYFEYEGASPFNTGSMAIDIEGTYVPEPTTAFLCCGCLVGMLLRRVR